MNFQDDFKGKVAIITGAAGGLGKAAAMAFAASGAKVVIGDVKVKEGKQTAEEIKIAGGEAIFVELDLLSKASVDAMVKKTVDTFGTVDILANVAGTNGGVMAPDVTGLTEKGWDTTYKVNLRGCVFTIQAVYNIFKEKKSGKVINISSLAAFVPPSAIAPYAASKSALNSLTRTMAQEMAAFNVNVNAIAPGFIFTAIYESAELQETAKAMGCTCRDLFDEFVKQHTLLKRGQTHEDIANMILFLCSDGAQNITGEIISVDGGASWMC